MKRWNIALAIFAYAVLGIIQAPAISASPKEAFSLSEDEGLILVDIRPYPGITDFQLVRVDEDKMETGEKVVVRVGRGDLWGSKGGFFFTQKIQPGTYIFHSAWARSGIYFEWCFAKNAPVFKIESATANFISRNLLISIFRMMDDKKIAKYNSEDFLGQARTALDEKGLSLPIKQLEITGSYSVTDPDEPKKKCPSKGGVAQGG